MSDELAGTEPSRSQRAAEFRLYVTCIDRIPDRGDVPPSAAAQRLGMRLTEFRVGS
jgi:hypothetical protein